MATRGCVQVQATAGSKEEADRVASVLLERRLAACVQVLGPIESRYWWQGGLDSATEWLCLAKTTGDRVEDVVTAIEETHSYETPEILATTVSGGNERYLRWVEETVILGP
jgi:periplasmic divalent cation tolerance protein